MIALAVAGALTTVSVPLAVAAFAVFLAAIYLRGYLIPGTPGFTKQYFPDRLLRLFDKQSTNEPVTGPEEDIDPETVLRDANAVTECEHEDDLCLTDVFQAAWRDRITTLRSNDTTRNDLAAILDIDPDTLAFKEHGDGFVATVDGSRIGQWESHAAFIADIAAANELRDRYSGWTRIPIDHRSRMLNGLRIFLEQCPVCNGTVSVDQEVVESCCRSIDVIAATCDDCGSRLFEAEQPPA